MFKKKDLSILLIYIFFLKRDKNKTKPSSDTCAAADAAGLCCHAAVLWQHQMNFRLPIPQSVLKAADGPWPFFFFFLFFIGS